MGLGDAAWRSEEHSRATEIRGAKDSPVRAPSSGQSLNHMSDMHKFLRNERTGNSSVHSSTQTRSAFYFGTSADHRRVCFLETQCEEMEGEHRPHQKEGV